MSYALLIPAAGRGERLGDLTSKALVVVNGKPLIWWALNAFVDDDNLKQIVVATSRENDEGVRACLDAHVLSGVIVTCEGGSTRQDSVGNALALIDSNVEHVLVHDAARPLLTKLVIDNVLAGLSEHVAAVPGVVVTDTIKRVDEKLVVFETLARAELFAVQTPQGIRRNEFCQAHQLAREHNVQCTDDVALIEFFKLGKVKLVPGDPRNLKITHPHELLRAEILLR